MVDSAPETEAERTSVGLTDSRSRRGFLRSAVAAGALAGLAGCTGGGGGGGGGDGGSGDGGDGSDGGDGGGSGTTAGGTASSSGDLADKINVYTFGGKNAEGIKKAYIDGFSEEFGVEVNHQTIASGWDLIPKIKNDSVTAHIVEQNPGSVLGGLPDVWSKIRLENIPTVMENLTVDKLKGSAPETSFDPGEDWHYVPKEVWAQGLVYNHDKLDEPSSWMDIYTDELQGKLTNTGFTALALGVAASEAGVDFNEIEADSSVKETIFERVRAQNEYVYQWWESGSSAQQLLTRESALAGNFWYGRVAALRQSEGVPVSYTVPEEGTVSGVSSWTVGVSEDPGRYTAEKFLDYTARPEPSREYAEFIPYFQPFPVPDAPEAYANNPDKANIDKLNLWDYELVSKNRENWSQEFQKAISG